MTDFLHPMHNRTSTPRPRRWLRTLVLALLVGAGIVTASKLGGTSFTVVRGMRAIIGPDGTVQLAPKLPKLDDDPEYELPDNDKSRLDILLLGVRGEGDSVNGGLLTDSILLLSLDTKTGRASMTSIPRDLTVRVTDEKTEKINAAYVYNGVAGAKKLYSRILGVGIDNVVVIDFEAFRHVVDTIGGVTVTLAQPFEESQQWSGEGEEGYVFSLPAGTSTLTGEQALYYVRSRYSSSDFDRARRQQQVMLAIKSKIEGLDLLSDPIKAVQIMTAIRKHLKSDLDIFDLGTIRELIAQGGQMDKIRRYQLTTENLLYEDKINGVYELLPRGGTLSHIKEFFRTVLQDTPVMSAPTLTPSATVSPAATSSAEAIPAEVPRREPSPGL